MYIVGLTLRPQPDGSCRVVGIVEEDGWPSLKGIEPGVRLIDVYGMSVTGQSMGAVIDGLRGKPGEARTILVDHKGARRDATAAVKRFL